MTKTEQAAILREIQKLKTRIEITEALLKEYQDIRKYLLALREDRDALLAVAQFAVECFERKHSDRQSDCRDALKRAIRRSTARVERTKTVGTYLILDEGWGAKRRK